MDALQLLVTAAVVVFVVSSMISIGLAACPTAIIAPFGERAPPAPEADAL